jgi:hypothetical protein
MMNREGLHWKLCAIFSWASWQQAAASDMEELSVGRSSRCSHKRHGVDLGAAGLFQGCVRFGASAVHAHLLPIDRFNHGQAAPWSFEGRPRGHDAACNKN